MPPTPRLSASRTLTRHASPADPERAASFMRSFDALRSPQKQSLSRTNSLTNAQGQAESHKLSQLEQEIHRLSREREALIRRHGIEIFREREIATGLRARIASLEERSRNRDGEEEVRWVEEKEKVAALMEELNLEKVRRKELEKLYERDTWDLREGMDKERRSKERAKETVKEVERERNDAMAALENLVCGRRPLQAVDPNISSLRSPPSLSAKTMVSVPDQPDIFSQAAHEHLKQQHKHLQRAYRDLQAKYQRDIGHAKAYHLKNLQRDENHRAKKRMKRMEELGMSALLSETRATIEGVDKGVKEEADQEQGHLQTFDEASGATQDPARQHIAPCSASKGPSAAEAGAPGQGSNDYSSEEESITTLVARSMKPATRSHHARACATTQHIPQNFSEKQPKPPRRTASPDPPEPASPAPQAVNTISSSHTTPRANQPRASPALSPFVRDRLGASTPVSGVSTAGPSLRKTTLLRTFPDPSTPGGTNAYPSGIASSSKSTMTGEKRKAIDMEGLSPAEKAVQRRILSKMPAKERRELYKEYKKGGRHMMPEELREDVTEEYEIDPEQNEGAKFAFHDVKRKKTERKQMHGGDCECCRGYYEAVGVMPNSTRRRPAWRDGEDDDEDDEQAGVREHQNRVSRHRETWVKPPTPPGYWQIGFPDTQEVEELNRKADEMASAKEARIVRELGQRESKWRKKT
ncbi:hypothetical protein IAT38_006802 [Cryptococcus sp. DSM 104549]